METISNLTTAVSTAIWGEQEQNKDGESKPTTSHTEGSTIVKKNETAGVEPVNGQVGNVAAGEPYDKGNVEPISTADTTLPSTAAHTTPASALPETLTSTISKTEIGSATTEGEPLTSTEKTYLTYENLTMNPKDSSSTPTATGTEKDAETKEIPSIPTHSIDPKTESSISPKTASTIPTGKDISSSPSTSTTKNTTIPALTDRPTESSTSKNGIEEVGLSLPETTTSLPKTVDDKSRATGVVEKEKEGRVGDEKMRAKEEQIFPGKKAEVKETKAELGKGSGSEGEGKRGSLDKSVKKEDSHGSGEGKEKKSLKEKIKDKLHVHKH